MTELSFSERVNLRLQVERAFRDFARQIEPLVGEDRVCFCSDEGIPTEVIVDFAGHSAPHDLRVVRYPETGIDGGAAVFLQFREADADADGEDPGCISRYVTHDVLLSVTSDILDGPDATANELLRDVAKLTGYERCIWAAALARLVVSIRSTQHQMLRRRENVAKKGAK